MMLLIETHAGTHTHTHTGMHTHTHAHTHTHTHTLSRLALYVSRRVALSLWLFFLVQSSNTVMLSKLVHDQILPLPLVPTHKHTNKKMRIHTCSKGKKKKKKEEKKSPYNLASGAFSFN